MVGSGTREAQGRVRRGGLLDEGADCVCEVGFGKKAANASFQKQTPKEKLSKRELIESTKIE